MSYATLRKNRGCALADHPQTESLSPRERDVLCLLHEGLRDKQIGRRLEVSSATVKVHVSSILRRLGVKNRLQAVVVTRDIVR